MAVFVDDMFAPYGRMKMCHMIADSTDELLRMANDIGLSEKWIQKKGTPYEHFDVSMAYRQRAIAKGAIEVTKRELGRKIWDRRCSTNFR